MNQKSWPDLGLTDAVIEELYRRGRDYAERRIVLAHREDAVQHGMCALLNGLLDHADNYPEAPEERLKYLTKVLYRESMKFVTRKLSPDTNIPALPE